ncbi:MAG: type II toxin-antitoxin system RelE/ParE family toxin [Epsilonproteobacteria bacterium]|nr:type II toxin-antitoxin system RelE/ParE family toxin [Campylobacterota bacterium]
MRIDFSHKAYQRLEALAEYIHQESGSKKITASYLKKFRHYILETLTHFPLAGRLSEELAPNTRKLVYQGFSIIYRIGDERIEIVTIYRENLP